MCDGCFVRNKVIAERSEEIQLFVDCLVKAMDDLQDDDLRSEYTRKVYDENAISCSDSDLAHEIADRQYVGTEAMKQSDYVLGQAWVAITDFLVEAEKITAENAPNVAASINAEYVSKTVGRKKDNNNKLAHITGTFRTVYICWSDRPRENGGARYG